MFIPTAHSFRADRSMSREGVALLLEKGIQYDHSSQAHDCQPFYCRDEDTWTKINYKAESAKEWMKPLVRGNLTGMVQIPANWCAYSSSDKGRQVLICAVVQIWTTCRRTCSSRAARTAMGSWTRM